MYEYYCSATTVVKFAAWPELYMVSVFAEFDSAKCRNEKLSTSQINSPAEVQKRVEIMVIGNDALVVLPANSVTR